MRWRCREEGPRKEGEEQRRPRVHTCAREHPRCSDQCRDRYSWERMMAPQPAVATTARARAGWGTSRALLGHGQTEGRLLLLWRLLLVQDGASKGRASSRKVVVNICTFLCTWLGSFFCTHALSQHSTTISSRSGFCPSEFGLDQRLRESLLCSLSKPLVPTATCWLFSYAHLKMHVIPKIRSWIHHWSQEQQDVVGIHQRYSNEREKSNRCLKK